MSTLISIVTPCYNTPAVFLEQAYNSIVAQTYDNWEWCLCDDCSTSDETQQALAKIKEDKRVKLVRSATNGGIGQATQVAVEVASGDFIAFFDSDDLLTADALYEVSAAFSNHACDMVYSDESIIDIHNKQIGFPHYKPDFSPHYLLSNNYICHFVCVTKDLYTKSGGVPAQYDGSQDHAFLLRATELANGIYHIPRILYYWRHFNTYTRAGDTQVKASDSGVRAVADALTRRGYANIEVYSEPDTTVDNHKFIYRHKKDLTNNPKVSIVIPFKKSEAKLCKCLNSIFTKTTYMNYEILIVFCDQVAVNNVLSYFSKEQQSKIKTLYYAETVFNYANVLNFACRQSTGDYITVMHDGITIQTPDWLQQMLSYAMDTTVGIVSGGITDHRKNTVIYAGAYTHEKGTSSYFQNSPDTTKFWNRHSATTNVSIAYSICMLFSKDVYTKLNGFCNEYTVYHADVDFCLRLQKLNKYVVYIPTCAFKYEQSGTRKTNYTPAAYDTLTKADDNTLKNKHRDVLAKTDPFANKNLFSIPNNFCKAPLQQTSVPPCKHVLVSYIIPWYNDAPTTLTSLLAQRDANIECIVVYDGPPPDHVTNVIKALDDCRIKFVNTPTVSKNWGHTPRNFGIDYVSAHSAFTVFAGMDNYYFPTFTKEMLSVSMSSDTAAVYSNFYYNGHNWNMMNTSLALGHIDCGCFMVRTDIAKKIRWQHVHYEADWSFINAVKHMYGAQNIVKLPRSLFVHN